MKCALQNRSKQSKTKNTMGFFNSLINVASAATKIVLTPVAIVADIAVKVATGENPELTEGAIKSAGQDLEDAADDILP